MSSCLGTHKAIFKNVSSLLCIFLSHTMLHEPYLLFFHFSVSLYLYSALLFENFRIYHGFISCTIPVIPGRCAVCMPALLMLCCETFLSEAVPWEVGKIGCYTGRLKKSQASLLYKVVVSQNRCGHLLLWKRWNLGCVCILSSLTF